MDQFHAMTVFVAVAEAGGFAAAARALRMSPPAVTRAVSGLEERIGARLLVRTTRSVKLTETGARYLADCHRILADLAEADAAAAGAHATPTGTLTVTAPVMFGRLHVLPVLMAYLDAHDAVDARLLLLDRVTNMVEEGIDVAIRIGHLPDSALSAVRVGTIREVICGAPGYFAEHGVPETPGDLAEHRLVIADTSNLTSATWRFSRDGALEKAAHLQIRPRLVTNSIDAAIEAATAGWGLTRVLSYQVCHLVATGRLQLVLQAHEPPPLPVHVVHSEGRRANAKVRGFVDLAVARLRRATL